MYQYIFKTVFSAHLVNYSVKLDEVVKRKKISALGHQ